MQEEITNFKIRGLGNVLSPIPLENISQVNCKMSAAGNISINNFKYRSFLTKEGDPEKVILKVTVVDDTSKSPLSNAHLLLENDAHQFEGDTDITGAYRFYNVPKGEYSLTISKERYSSKENSIKLQKDQSIEIGLVPDTDPEKVTFKVKIFDKLSSIPLKGAHLLLESPSTRVEGETGETGEYRFYNVPKGEYSLTISKEKYISQTEFVKLQEDIYDEIGLVPDTDPEKVTLEVTVLDKVSKLPLSEAHLLLESNVRKVEGDTDEKGSYKFSDVPKGDYSLTISKEKYISKKYETKLERDISLSFAVEPKEPLVHELKIIVLDNTSQSPLSEAHILLKEGTDQFEGDTNEKGECLFQVKTGTYNLQVSKEKYISKDTTLNVFKDSSFTIALNKEIEPEKRHLTITVKDKETQEVIPDALTKLTGHGVSIERHSDEKGFCEFVDLEKGTYTLEITKEEYRRKTQTIELQEDVALNIELIPTIPKFCSLKIRVQDSLTFLALGGAHLILESEKGQLEGFTDETGTFEFKNLEKRAYKLTITKEKYETQTKSIQLEKDEEIVITLERNIFSLSIHVSNYETSEKIGGAHVIIDEERTDKLEGDTDEKGICKFDKLKKGEHKIFVFKEKFVVYKDTISVDNDKDIGVFLKIQTFSLNCVAIDNRTRIPMEKTHLVLEGISGKLEGDTDEKGNYTFKNLKEGDYILTASKEDYATKTNNISLHTNLDVLCDLTHQAEVKVKLVVSVSDHESKTALKDVLVTFNNIKKSTDDKGVCEFTEIQKGAYSLLLQKEGYVTEKKIINLQKDEVLSYELEPEDHIINLDFSVIDHETKGGVEGAHVLLESSEGHSELVTDENGCLSFGGLSKGKVYKYTISKEQYASQANTIVMDSSAKIQIVLVHLNYQFKVRTVSEFIEFPIDKVKLTLENSEGKILEGETDEEGVYIFKPLTKGHYNLIFTNDDYYHAPDPINLEVDVDHTIHMRRKVQRGSFRVDWTVVDNFNNPLDDVYVLMENTEGWTKRVHTQGGKCVIEHMRGGICKVDFYKREYYLHKMYLDLKEDSSYKVVLNHPREKGPYNLQLTVKDKNTKLPLENVHVLVGEETEETYVAEGYTNERGIIDFYDIDHTFYYVVFEKDRYTPHKQRIVVEGDDHHEILLDSDMDTNPKVLLTIDAYTDNRLQSVPGSARLLGPDEKVFFENKEKSFIPIQFLVDPGKYSLTYLSDHSKYLSWASNVSIPRMPEYTLKVDLPTRERSHKETKK